MKKYTNKILIITIIVVVLAMVIGRTIDFQTGYRSGRITYEEIKPDTTQGIVFDDLDDMDAYADSVTVADNKPETSHQ